MDLSLWRTGRQCLCGMESNAIGRIIETAGEGRCRPNIGIEGIIMVWTGLDIFCSRRNHISISQ